MKVILAWFLLVVTVGGLAMGLVGYVIGLPLFVLGGAGLMSMLGSDMRGRS